jgi:hypothetical protein
MSKLLAAAVIVFLALIAGENFYGLWMDRQREQATARDRENLRQAALESESLSAWRYATDYDNFFHPMKD